MHTKLTECRTVRVHSHIRFVSFHSISCLSLSLRGAASRNEMKRNLKHLAVSLCQAFEWGPPHRQLLQILSLVVISIAYYTTIHYCTVRILILWFCVEYELSAKFSNYDMLLSTFRFSLEFRTRIYRYITLLFSTRTLNQ